MEYLEEMIRHFVTELGMESVKFYHDGIDWTVMVTDSQGSSWIEKNLYLASAVDQILDRGI